MNITSKANATKTARFGVDLELDISSLTRLGNLDFRHQYFVFQNLPFKELYRVVNYFIKRVVKIDCSIEQALKTYSDGVMVWTVQARLNCSGTMGRSFEYIFSDSTEYDGFNSFCKTHLRNDKIDNLLQ